MITDEQIAELDAVMAKATAGEWAAKMWDSPYKIGIWAKDGADYKTCTPIATGRAKAPDKRLLDELHLIAYEREQVPIVEANISAIVALHNAYPDLRAHIDAQAATITRLREALHNPPKHVYWGAGEPDCPRDILAGNGELHTLRCKVCGKGLSEGRICLAGIVK